MARRLMDSQRNAADVRCNFSMSKDRFAVCVRACACETECVPDFLSSSSALSALLSSLRAERSEL